MSWVLCVRVVVENRYSLGDCRDKAEAEQIAVGHVSKLRAQAKSLALRTGRPESEIVGYVIEEI